MIAMLGERAFLVPTGPQVNRARYANNLRCVASAAQWMREQIGRRRFAALPIRSRGRCWVAVPREDGSTLPTSASSMSLIVMMY
jgi:hypothetical protein